MERHTLKGLVLIGTVSKRDGTIGKYYEPICVILEGLVVFTKFSNILTQINDLNLINCLNQMRS